MKYYYNFFVNNEKVYGIQSNEYIKINKNEKMQLEFTSPGPEKKKKYIDYDIENIEKLFKEAFSTITQFNISFYTINLYLKEVKNE